MPEANRGAAVQLTDLVKEYAGVRALDGVSLDIPAGEFVTLLGPSGSGKTTTLNAIAGFQDPDQGHILIGGGAIEKVPPHRRNIGMVFQSYALFPHMTAAANVAFPLKQRKVPRSERLTKVAEALRLVGLEGMGGRYPRQMSGGQQQRVALARALVFEPSVLLMDEPLGALDKRLREALQLEFRRIHAELGITFIYVTHDQDEALVMSDRIAVFNEGRIEQVGTAEDLYERPATLFVAQFLGDSNVLRGTWRDGHLVRDGFALGVTDATGLVDGAAGVLVVRPERMRLVGWTDDVDPCMNVVSGRIRQVIYRGDRRWLEVDLEIGVPVFVQESVWLESTVIAGDRVSVAWAPEHSMVFADGAAPTARRGAATAVERTPVAG